MLAYYTTNSMPCHGFADSRQPSLTLSLDWMTFSAQELEIERRSCVLGKKSFRVLAACVLWCFVKELRSMNRFLTTLPL